MVVNKSSELPPGFRFHPTDEELITYYLRNQATSRPCPASIIPEVDIYKFDPWQLPEKAGFGESEWFFFSPRDRKYPNGARPNRAAVSGYWKATGTDKAIYNGSKCIGVKKALVFYKGRPPKGSKTDWIMHEYRLIDSLHRQSIKQNGSMRLDDWVLCRIYKKKNMTRAMEQMVGDSSAQTVTTIDNNSASPSLDSQALKFPRACSLSQLWDLDCMGSSISQLLNENPYSSAFGNYQSTIMNNGSSGSGTQLGMMESPYHQLYMMDSVKLEAGNQISSAVGAAASQPIFVNHPLFEFH